MGLSLKIYFKILLKYLPALSLIAAAIYFFNIDFDFQLEKTGLTNLFLSFLFILLFFFVKSFTWHRLLRKYHINVSLGLAIYSQYRTIFTKYIPGKIWIVLSSASIISRKGYSLKKVSALSFFHILIQTIGGLIVGFSGFLFFNFKFFPPSIAFLCLIVIFLFVIVISVRDTIPGLGFIKKIPGLQSLVFIKLKPVFDLIVISTGQWILLGFAYYFLLQSLQLYSGIEPVLLQPLANNIGIIVPISPGGIGVREYAMIGYLSVLIDVQEAGNFALIARVWFFIAEIMIYLTSFLIQEKTSLIFLNH